MSVIIFRNLPFQLFLWQVSLVSNSVKKCWRTQQKCFCARQSNTDQTFNFFVVVEMIVCYSYERILVWIDGVIIRMVSHHRWSTQVSKFQSIYVSSSLRRLEQFRSSINNRPPVQLLLQHLCTCWLYQHHGSSCLCSYYSSVP